MSATFGQNSYLKDRWYIVLNSDELKNGRLLKVRRLGMDIVFWRDGKNGVHAVDARCPHRGADLGLGKVVDGCVQCPYHGFLFDGIDHAGPAVKWRAFLAPRVHPHAIHRERPGARFIRPGTTFHGAHLRRERFARTVSSVFQAIPISAPSGGFPMSEMTQQAQEVQKNYPRTAYTLSLVAGILMIVSSAVEAVIVVPFFMVAHEFFSIAPLEGAALFGLISGIIVMVSATMLRSRPAEGTTWGILIIVFSIFSFFGMGGFVVGAILGIIGGAFALSQAPVRGPD
ncbi:MAG: Rieske 2Fe-2S domain-containing protein [Conexivisphaera sp.]